MILLRQNPTATDHTTQPISQSAAMIVVIMVVGIAAFLWYQGYLRSRAALVAILGIIAVFAYLAFWTNPVTAP